MPLRMKEVHIIRQPFLFNMVWPMFKQFVGDKLKKRVSKIVVIPKIIYIIHVSRCVFVYAILYLKRRTLIAEPNAAG